MGNLTRRLAALDFGGHRMLLDELLSSKEVMIRIPSEAVQWIDREPPVLRLIESLVQILEELPSRARVSPRPSVKLTPQTSGNLQLGSGSNSESRIGYQGGERRSSDRLEPEKSQRRSTTPQRNFSRERQSLETDQSQSTSRRFLNRLPTEEEPAPQRSHVDFSNNLLQRGRDGSISVESDMFVGGNELSFRRSNTYQADDRVHHLGNEQKKLSARPPTTPGRNRDQPEKVQQASISDLQRKINQKLEFATHELATISLGDDTNEVSWRLDTDLPDRYQDAPFGNKGDQYEVTKPSKLGFADKENHTPVGSIRHLFKGADHLTPSKQPNTKGHIPVSTAEARPRIIPPPKPRNNQEESALISHVMLTKPDRAQMAGGQSGKESGLKSIVQSSARDRTPGRIDRQQLSKEAESPEPETDSYLELRGSNPEFRNTNYSKRGGMTELATPIQLGYKPIGPNRTGEGKPTHFEREVAQPAIRKQSEQLNPLLRLGSIESESYDGKLQNAESFDLEQPNYHKDW